jgi:hypothetical protein
MAIPFFQVARSFVAAGSAGKRGLVARGDVQVAGAFSPSQAAREPITSSRAAPARAKCLFWSIFLPCSCVAIVHFPFNTLNYTKQNKLFVSLFDVIDDFWHGCTVDEMSRSGSFNCYWVKLISYVIKFSLRDERVIISPDKR